MTESLPESCPNKTGDHRLHLGRRRPRPRARRNLALDDPDRVGPAAAAGHERQLQFRLRVHRPGAELDRHRGQHRRRRLERDRALLRAHRAGGLRAHRRERAHRKRLPDVLRLRERRQHGLRLPGGLRPERRPPGHRQRQRQRQDIELLDLSRGRRAFLGPTDASRPTVQATSATRSWPPPVRSHRDCTRRYPRSRGRIRATA